jgi:hypothetical protein
MSTSKELFELSVNAGSDLSSNQFYLVKRSAGVLALCSTAGERPLGVLQDDPAASGRSGLVRVAGLTKVELGGTVTQDAPLTVDANGKAVAAGDGPGFIWGFANEAGSSGEIINAIIGLAGAGGPLSKGVIQLPLAVARELGSNEYVNTAGDAGVLSNDTTPLIEAANPGTDQVTRLNWAATNVDKIAWQVALPQDLNAAYPVTLHTLSKMAGATDTPAITWEAFWGEGDSDSGSAATPALSATLAEQIATIAAADVLAHPNVLNVTLVPGAHGTDIAYLYGAWIEYTRA